MKKKSVQKSLEADCKIVQRKEQQISPLNPVKVLQARLKQQEDRCSNLQKVMADQRHHSHRILQGNYVIMTHDMSH